MAENLKVIKDTTANFRKALEALPRRHVLVGVPEGKDNRKPEDGETGPINNAALLYIQDKGSPARNIPARPVMEPGIKAVQDKIAQELKVGARDCVKDPDAPQKALVRAGITAVSSIKATITKGEGFAPLADSTLKARRRKGKNSTKPLIVTGQLRNSINFVVREKK